MARKTEATKGILMLTILLLFIATPAECFFRHLCHGDLALARLDPLMAPGKASQHLHAISGASNFGLDPTLNELMTSNCSNCAIMQDKSVYWTPQLYFQHGNGTFELVPKAGGLTVYYFTEKPQLGNITDITAFPKGFRMIAGNSIKRHYFGPVPYTDESLWTDSDRTQQALMEKSIGFNCLHYNDNNNEGALEFHYLRNKTFLDEHCYDGVRAELQFPSCWNGQDLDSKNHTTHVAYPFLLRQGDCPAGFPVRLPTLFYETIYTTNTFKGIDGQFVFANGDPTGYGYHGDFMSGWDDGILQQAIDDYNCTTHDPTYHESTGIQEECPKFTFRTPEQASSCKMKLPEVVRNEQINFVDELPGGMAIQSGPGFATGGSMHKGMSTPTEASNPATSMPMPSASPIITPYPNTTTAAAPPGTTPSPTAVPSGSNSVLTRTSVYVENGTTIHMVIIQQVVTETVTAEPTAEATAARRHVHHRHNKHIGGRFRRH